MDSCCTGVASGMRHTALSSQEREPILQKVPGLAGISDLLWASPPQQVHLQVCRVFLTREGRSVQRAQTWAALVKSGPVVLFTNCGALS